MELFKGIQSYDHKTKAKIGVLLVNLGTPDAPTKEALRPYLKQFLSDPRVIEVSRPLWWIILRLFILPFRPKKSAELYQRIWTEEGSPLLIYTQRQAKLLQESLDAQNPETFVVEAGMGIGNPSVESALLKLQARGATKLLALPLFPQYSGTTTASGFDAVTNVLQTWRWIPEFRMIMSYHDHPLYIEALTASIQELWERDGRPEKLLMSFHGIPKRYFENGDPYFCYCQKTARLLAEKLGLKKEEYIVSFQSLFGKEEWLRPYTSETLEALAKGGVKRLDVICPGFSADCLETLEEIEEENKEIFLKNAGGKEKAKFRYIHALNDRPDHIRLLLDLVKVHSSGWSVRSQEEPEQIQNRVNETKY